MNDKYDVVVWLLFISAVAITLGIIVLGLHFTDSPPSLSIPGIVIIILGLSGLWTARKLNRVKLKKS